MGIKQESWETRLDYSHFRVAVKRLLCMKKIGVGVGCCNIQAELAGRICGWKKGSKRFVKEQRGKAGCTDYQDQRYKDRVEDSQWGEVMEEKAAIESNLNIPAALPLQRLWEKDYCWNLRE